MGGWPWDLWLPSTDSFGPPEVRQDHEDLKKDPCGLMRRLSFRIDVRSTKHLEPLRLDFDLNENDGSIWFYVNLRQYLDSIIYTYIISYTYDLFCSFQQALT